MARLYPDSEFLADYYLDLVRPDLIAVHSPWLERYCDEIFGTEKFDALYEPIGSTWSGQAACDSNKALGVVWIHRGIKAGSLSRERILLNDLQSDLSLIRVREELAACQESQSPCHYVARTVFRFIPELRQSGMLVRFENLFHDPIDRALLSSSEAPISIKVFEENQSSS